MAAYPRQNRPPAPEKPYPPAQREADIIGSVLSILQVVDDGIAHVTEPDHVCDCDDPPPDWADMSTLIYYLEELRGYVKALGQHRREVIAARLPE